MAAGKYQKHDRDFRKRWFVNPSQNLVSHVLTVPDDVERRESHVPCGYCGVRAGIACRHRPWEAVDGR